MSRITGGARALGMPPHARHGAKSVKVRWLHLCQDASYDRRHPLSPPQWSLACLFAYCLPRTPVNGTLYCLHKPWALRLTTLPRPSRTPHRNHVRRPCQAGCFSPHAGCDQRPRGSAAQVTGRCGHYHGHPVSYVQGEEGWAEGHQVSACATVGTLSGSDPVSQE